MVHPRRSLWGAAIAALVLGAACNPFAGGDDAPATTQPPPATQPPSRIGLSVDGVVRLGAVVPLTGELARLGPGMQAAVELAIDEINDAGGIGGKDVELVVADSQSTPEQARAATQTLIDASNVDAVVGPASSVELVPGVVEEITSAGRVACSPAASSALLSTLDEGGLVFSLGPRRDGAGLVVARRLAERGAARVTVVERDDPVSADLAGRLRADLAAAIPSLAVSSVLVAPGGPVTEPPPPATTTTTAEPPDPPDPPDGPVSAEVAAQIVASSPVDAVVVVAGPEEGVPFLRALAAAGILPLGDGAPALVLGEQLATEDLGPAVDPERPGLLAGVIAVRPDVLVNTSGRFTARLRGETGLPAGDLELAAPAYDCAALLLLAAIGGDDPAAMAERLPGVATDGEACGGIVACADAVTAGAEVAYTSETGVVVGPGGHPVEGYFDELRFGDRGRLEGVDTWRVTYGPDPVAAEPGAVRAEATPPAPTPAPPAGAGRTTTTVVASPTPATTTTTAVRTTPTTRPV